MSSVFVVGRTLRYSCFRQLLVLIWNDTYTGLIADIRVVARLRHPCVTTVMGAVVEAGVEPLLVTEIMEQGSLQDLLHNQSLILEGDLIDPILGDIVQGMRFLHATKPLTIHGDLKSHNILVDSKFRAKITDFGLSATKAYSIHSRKGATGTAFWMAPELLAGSPNTTASDVYAFGIVLSEVYARDLPYNGEDMESVLEQVCDLRRLEDKRPVVPTSTPAIMCQLMSDCWRKDETKRLSFKEIDERLKKLSADTCQLSAEVINDF
jgi:serine/threonine protein kinase